MQGPLWRPIRNDVAGNALGQLPAPGAPQGPPVSGSPLTAASSKGVSSTLASSGQKDTKNFIHGILLISVFSLFKRDFSHLKPSLPLAEDQTILSLHPKLPRPFLAPAVTPRVFHSYTLFHTSFTLSCTNTQQLSSD